jgi:hypothetical protein
LYAQLRKLDRVSLAGMFDMDTAEISRTSILALSQVAKLPAFWDLLDKGMNKIEQAINHPDDPKKWIFAAQAAGIFMPTVPKVGNVVSNKHLGQFAEFMYRSITGDWEMRTPKNHKYQAKPFNEAKEVITGRSLVQNLENLDRDLPKTSSF